jgi:flagellin-like protein
MRAITPIIATILLLLMAVAAAGAAYLWITLMQSTIAGESQSGLEQNIAQMQRQLTIPSVWNESGYQGKICFLIKNAGSEAYTAPQLKDSTVYIEGRAYDWNTTNVGITEFGTGDTIAVCVCQDTTAGATECLGPTNTGYNYTGSKIDVKIEPPVGNGGTYNNFQNVG